MGSIHSGAVAHSRPSTHEAQRSADSDMQKILAQLATEIRIRPDQVKTAVELLDGGATVPFIARYRKEVTGGLDDIQLRELEARLGYLRELEDRRAAVIKSRGRYIAASVAVNSVIGQPPWEQNPKLL